MIKSILQVFSLVLFTVSAMAQQGNLYDSNNQVLVQNRYDKIDGSPYMLENWAKGILYPIKGEPIRQEKINFNGASGKFDIVENNISIELNAALYNKIEMMEEGKTYLFMNRIQENDLTYYRVLHEGNGYIFLEKFDSDLKSQGANYGISAEKEKFIPRTSNFIWKEGQMHALSRNPKKIIEFFDSPALQKQVKNQKLNLKEDVDLIAALTYYDEQIAQK